jgi:uncharacterized protein (DUF1501 family)
MNNQPDTSARMADGVCSGPDQTSSLFMPGRRSVIKAGVGGLLGLMLADALQTAGAQTQKGSSKSGKPKSCILLWMNGGPSHLDTWDPKPGAVTGGPFKAIKTRAADIQICEHLPQVADVADKIAIVRSMTSKEGNHQRAQYLMHTGYTPNPTIVHPSLGAWVTEELADPHFDLPSFVSISGPSYGAGFLGVQYGPLVVQTPGQMPQNVAYATGVTPTRFDKRQEALAMLEGDFAKQTGDSKVAGRMSVYGKAVNMMRSPRLKAFDISEEPEAVKAAYGDTNFGKGCLMARRLVESGVRFVEVVLDGWDTHQDNFNRVQKQMNTFDPAMATLIKELSDRKLLDDTLIVWMGEFGRTPKINGNEGRDHYPGAWSAVMAGAGVRGGTVYGATNEDGTKPADKPTPVSDLFATYAALLGMDCSKTFTTPIGRPISITEKGTPIAQLIS